MEKKLVMRIHDLAYKKPVLTLCGMPVSNKSKDYITRALTFQLKADILTACY